MERHPGDADLGLHRAPSRPRHGLPYARSDGAGSRRPAPAPTSSEQCQRHPERDRHRHDRARRDSPPSTAADANGWHAAPFTVTWDGSDAGSGSRVARATARSVQRRRPRTRRGGCTDLAAAAPRPTTATSWTLRRRKTPLLVGHLAHGANVGPLVASNPDVSATDKLRRPDHRLTPSVLDTFAAAGRPTSSRTAADAAKPGDWVCSMSRSTELPT